MKFLGFVAVLCCASCTPAQPTFAVHQCELLEVIDGDSIKVRCQKQADNSVELEVRLHCIDAPEMGQKPYGVIAKNWLQKSLSKNLQITDWGMDKYGRTLGGVRSTDRDVQALLIRAGAVVVYRDFCTNPDYLLLEATAKRSNLGVWHELGMHQEPWLWRRLQPPRAASISR